MCMFVRQNYNFRSEAYKKGLTTFECGCCPECLAKRARQWSLRAAMQAKVSLSCMVTLTYDQYVRNAKGEIIGEQLVLRHVAKRDVQLFVKRLRKHFRDTPIKYLITAEYGKRTGRPHYHALLFGIDFDDRIFCKTSKRGNRIYRSATLEKIWKQGICTVDAVNVSAKVARYCTKYCAKDGRSSDTFMLFSRGIGESELLRQFNGKSYWLDGKEYPIPRQIWNKVIEKRYSKYADSFTYKYLNKGSVSWSLFADNELKRRIYRVIRDNDQQYIDYLSYWRRKGEVYESSRPTDIQRIYLLPDSKYHSYKIKALYAKIARSRSEFPVPIPRRSDVCQRREMERYLYEKFRICPMTSRHERANDTKAEQNRKEALLLASTPLCRLPLNGPCPFNNPSSQVKSSK